MKLGLGTVQFGMRYGVSNQRGMPGPDEVSRILKLAQQSGISTIDTATLYGSSEEVLGSSLSPGSRFSIVTKTPQGKSPDELQAAFMASLKKLKQDKIYGLLIHDPKDLLRTGSEKLVEKLWELRAQNRVERIGFSAYRADQIAEITARFKGLNLIQVPLNYFDQRLLRDGTLRELKELGYEIHVRSAFLQGILLMEPSALGAHFDSVRKHLGECQTLLKNAGLNPLEGALAFLASIKEIDRVIIGVTSEDELRQVVAAWKAVSAKQTPIEFKSLAWSDETILDPSLWKFPQP